MILIRALISKIQKITYGKVPILLHSMLSILIECWLSKVLFKPSCLPVYDFVHPFILTSHFRMLARYNQLKITLPCMCPNSCLH